MVSSTPPEYIFSVGQQVDWNKETVGAFEKDTGLDVREGIRDETGKFVIPGPFSITRIVSMISRCTCGEPAKKPTDQHVDQHKDECGVHDRKRNGHRQRIFIAEWNCGITGKFLRPV